MLKRQADNRAEIGNRLREFGLAHYSSLNAFAVALGVAQPILSNYLSGRYRPGNKMQARLRELGCDIEWLITGRVTDAKKALDQFVREHPGSYIPDGLPEKTRKRIKQLIDEVKDLDESEIDRVREIIRMIFGTAKKRRR